MRIADISAPRYGVSRVYDQQCGYVLSDVQTLQTTMRGLLRIMRNRGLDLDAEKTKLETF